MPGGLDKQQTDMINRVVRHSRSKVRGPKGKRLEVFIRKYLANVPASDLDGMSAADIFNLVREHSDFAAKRGRGKASVRVYTPSKSQNNYASDHTVIEVVNDDMPFLVDSVTAAVNRRGLTAHLIIHPIMKVRRDGKGQIKEILEAGEADRGSVAESYIHVQVSEQPKSRHADIRKNIEAVLTDVRAAVDDWRPMRERMLSVIEELEIEPKGTNPEDAHEVREFLRWIHDNNFTFLGFREFDLTGSGSTLRAKRDEKSSLGVLRSSDIPAIGQIQKMPPQIRGFVTKPSLLLITKTDHRATVHRSVNMDVVAVKKIDAKGKVVGYRIFVGLFTSVAYNKSPRDIPLLRRRIAKIIDKAGFGRTSHDGKSLTNVLETFPRDELFQASDAYLYSTAMGILNLQERQRVALFVRNDNFQRFVSSLVFVPRERYTTELRHRLQEILVEEFGGTDTTFFTQLGDSPLARIHFIVTTPEGKIIPSYDTAKIEARLAETARSWEDKVSEALTAMHGEGIGLELLDRYASAFGAGYRDRYKTDEVLDDIDEIERILVEGGVGMNLYKPDGAAPDEVRFKIYHFSHPIPLSDVLPVFEHMGFKVIDEGGPHRVDLSGIGRDSLVIHNFGLRARSGANGDLGRIRNNFQDAFARVWDGEIESDGFNALVTGGDLAWREIVVLRAYSKYLRQAGITFSQDYMAETMVNNPKLAAGIVDLFQCIFDPVTCKESGKKAPRIKRRILKGLEEVESADEDRIIRRFLNLVESTLRTNYYQPDEDGNTKAYMSFKLNSRELDELPLPRPLREIFVYSPRVEGVHLRFGFVARGGLRWSDRREDFRTEILGLVKAQQVKNAVIVPVGSKGGFVVKRPPATGGRDAFLEEGINCYKTFISGLLDLTDNIKGPRIVAPKNVVRRDADDPYLVVAADKGTATFSDIANGVSIEYGHWLGDAFASGGSQGYDHKKMGITARGGWESVKRHFREMGTDIQNEDFTVVGVGDMGGDVFGNGMLLSKHIKLQGAFNHLHIFVDPDPDPAKSWIERKRLFDNPGLSWADYDNKVMSKGAAVYSRSAKSLDLSPEVREVFGISKKSVTPDELMGHLLRAECDLLWFGGIGTYVKATAESHLDAGDRANDSIRINGNELRCKVIGEGANLGTTQRGRVEFAENGGRLNTDSIDNSAGVDSSDHEVNIKILVDSVMAAGGLSEKARNALLAKMTDEVAELVLAHNYRQTQALTVTESKGVAAMDNQRRFMRFLERADRLDRGVEFLPDDETIAERVLANHGLARPELSVLISYAKIWLYDELIASDMPDDPYLLGDLIEYFPTPLRQKYKSEIADHRLRREIIATRATNSLVDRAGDTFVFEFMEKTGLGAAEITRAYVITREAFKLRGIWKGIEALDNKVPSSVQTSMLNDVNHLIEWVVLWLLRNGEAGLDIGAHIDAYKDGLARLAAEINKALPAHYVSDAKKRARPYIDQGVPEALALRVAGLVNLYSGCDIVRLAARRNVDVIDTARFYFAVGTRFRLGRLRAAAEYMDSDSHWQQLAVAALVEEIYSHQLALANKVLDFAGVKADAKKAVGGWIDKNHALVEPTEQLLTELWATEVNDLSMIAVASRQIRTMVDAGV